MIKSLVLFAGGTLALLLISCSNSAHLRNIQQLKGAENPCAAYGCEGTFLAGITWEDGRGENAFIVTEKRQENEEGERQSLIPVRYLMNGPKPKSTWQGLYSAENWCDAGEGVIGEIEVTDIDEDGVGEVLYVYNVEGNCDVSPKTYGLVLHSGTELYEITGTDDLQVNRGIPGSAEMKFSESFNTAPAGFRDHAVEAWKRLVPHD